MQIDSALEKKIRDQEAIHEIMNLEADYCYAADSYDGESFANLFTENGVLDIIPMGRTIGRKALMSLCRDQFSRGFSFAMHFLHNPRIQVNGDTATGKFYWQASLTYLDTNTPTNAAGTYESKYTKTDKGWKIKEKVVNFIYDTPYDKGWVKQKFYS